MVTNFKRQLIISFSIIIGSVVIATIALYILSGQIDAQVKKIQSDRALVSDQTDALDLLSNLKGQVPQAVAYQSAIDQLLPTQDGLIGFTDWLSGIADEDHVTATASFTGNLTPPDEMSAGESFFSLEIVGPLSNIISFLNDIEAKSPGFLLEINSFNLVGSGPNDQVNAQGDVSFRS